MYEFSPEDIVKGSGYISAQCCGSSELELGTVYSAEFGIRLFSEINRYTLKDAKVEPVYHLDLGDGTEEAVPMGIFEVSEANRTGKVLELKGYDYMLRFERNFAATQTTGTPYDFISLCCKACSVEMAQTQAQIEAMPNGTETLSIYLDNDIETYRDCLFYVGQILAGFFVINRVGKLELRQYGMTVVQTYKAEHRFSSSFSDFITRYTAVSSTNKKTETAEYYALETDDALTMNLGVNPLMQFGTVDAREAMCRNILGVISKIQYVPFDSDTIGNPALDLGDVLQFSGGGCGCGSACGGHVDGMQNRDSHVHERDCIFADRQGSEDHQYPVCEYGSEPHAVLRTGCRGCDCGQDNEARDCRGNHHDPGDDGREYRFFIDDRCVRILNTGDSNPGELAGHNRDRRGSNCLCDLRVQ